MEDYNTKFVPILLSFETLNQVQGTNTSRIILLPELDDLDTFNVEQDLALKSCM